MQVNSDFLAIEPLAIEGHPVIQRWKFQREHLVGGRAKECITSSQRQETRYWDLLKASAAYHEFHKTNVFPWYMAGVELGDLKATAGGKGTYRIVREDIFEAFKLDNKVVKRRQEMEAGGAMEEEDDEFGEFDWDIDVS